MAFSDVPLNNILSNDVCVLSLSLLFWKFLTVKSDYVNEVDHIFGAGINLMLKSFLTIIAIIM